MFSLAPWTFCVNRNGKEIGKIQKKFSGLLKELFTDSDNFGVYFPKEMSINEKCLIFASTFLIDMVYFENNKNNNN